ncbi:unnamed protein product, partial [Meganyctiphanes norvegica]
MGPVKEAVVINIEEKLITNTMIKKPLWGPRQPNNYNRKQNCAVLDGGSSWLWNDVGCHLNNIHWICQFKPRVCGSPDRNENTTISNHNFTRGSVISYDCLEGHQMLNDTNRTCLNTGLWSGAAPTCKY